MCLFFTVCIVVIVCPPLAEITALGAAYAAGRAVDVAVKLDGGDASPLKPMDSPAGHGKLHRI